MPDNASMPASRSSTVRATSSSHGSPAATSRLSPVRRTPPWAPRPHAARPPPAGGAHVRAAAQDQQRPAGLVGVPDGRDQLAGVGALHEPLDRTPHRQGGEVGEPSVLSHLHDSTLTGGPATL